MTDIPPPLFQFFYSVLFRQILRYFVFITFCVTAFSLLFSFTPAHLPGLSRNGPRYRGLGPLVKCRPTDPTNYMSAPQNLGPLPNSARWGQFCKMGPLPRSDRPSLSTVHRAPPTFMFQRDPKHAASQPPPQFPSSTPSHDRRADSRVPNGNQHCHPWHWLREKSSHYPSPAATSLRLYKKGFIPLGGHYPLTWSLPELYNPLGAHRTCPPTACILLQSPLQGSHPISNKLHPGHNLEFARCSPRLIPTGLSGGLLPPPLCASPPFTSSANHPNS